MAQLTIEAAKAYVTEMHAKAGETVDIEGAGIFADRGLEVCRLNVTVTGSPAGGVACVRWDVWSEPLAGGDLYGEC